MLVNGGVNAAGSEAAYLINNHDNLTWQGALGAGAGGFASGAIGGAAGPSGGTIAQHLGQRTTSVTSQLAAGGVNFAGGFTGSVIDQTISTGRVDYGNAALSGTVNAGTGELANRVAPSGNGMTSLSQHANFAPRTANGTFNFGATNTDAMWAQAGVGTLFGSTYEVVVN